MNREAAREMLLDYTNGNLWGEEKAAIERFLDQDDELRLELEGIRREISILRGAIIDPMEDVRLRRISSGVMNELRRQRAAGLVGMPLPWRSYMRAAAVVLLVVAGVVIFSLLRPGAAVETPEEPGAAAASAPREEIPAVSQPPEAAGRRAIRMALATSDPKVRIYWTFSENFEL